MKKQRICIVGDGLSGLMTIIALNKLPSVEAHLITKKNKSIFLLLTTVLIRAKNEEKKPRFKKTNNAKFKIKQIIA